MAIVRVRISCNMRNVMKTTRLLIGLLVILLVSGLDAGCVTESGNNYNLSPSVQKMEGGASMGKVNNARDAYSHAKFVKKS